MSTIRRRNIRIREYYHDEQSQNIRRPRCGFPELQVHLPVDQRASGLVSGCLLQSFGQQLEQAQLSREFVVTSPF